MVRIVVWLLIGIGLTICTAATGQTVRVLKGQIVDAKTGESVPYATIFVPVRQTGTIANGDGNFQLKLPITTSVDTVVFSMVGYTTHRLVLSPSARSPEELTIRLTPVTLTLNEVTVRPVDAQAVVREAVRRIRLNYYNKPVLLQGFYRENVREKSDLVFAEGSLELYKSAYGGQQGDEVRMLKGRRKKLEPYFMSGADTCHLPTITNGPHLGIILDIVKAPKQYAFMGAPDTHEYEYEGTTQLNGQDVLLIRFKARPGHQDGFYSGVLYVERESLAIIQADYELSFQGLYASNMALEAKQLPILLKHRQYRVRYQQSGGRWLMHDAQVDNEYQYILRPSAPIRNRMNFVVTKITTKPVKRFAAQDVISVNQAFVEQTLDFDDRFWDEDNILLDEQN